MTESRWYDKDGQPLGDAALVELRLGDPDYKRVAQTDVGEARVSTVWLGLDHGWRDGSPP